MIKKFLGWVSNSGASVTLVLNPCQWRWLPWADRDDVWQGPDYKSVTFGWLFVIVKAWIDSERW